MTTSEPVYLGPLLSIEELPDTDHWKHTVGIFSFLLLIGYTAVVVFTTPRHYITNPPSDMNATAMSAKE